MDRRAATARAGLVLLAVLALDQVTKVLVRSRVELGSEDPIFPAIKLVHVENRGVAFSALEGQTTLVALVISVALAGLAVYFFRHAERRLMWLPTGLLAGGALGNVVDRVFLGAVTDFLKLPGWPAFNVADVAITAGVVALLLVVEMAERRDAAADAA